MNDELQFKKYKLLFLFHNIDIPTYTGYTASQCHMQQDLPLMYCARIYIIIHNERTQ